MSVGCGNVFMIKDIDIGIAVGIGIGMKICIDIHDGLDIGIAFGVDKDD